MGGQVVRRRQRRQMVRRRQRRQMAVRRQMMETNSSNPKAAVAVSSLTVWASRHHYGMARRGNIIMFRVMWAEGGTNDGREGNTEAFPAITHSEMELKTELNDRVIRVYWALVKAWFIWKNR